MIGYLPKYYIGFYNEAPEPDVPFSTVDEAIEYYRRMYPEFTDITGNDLWVGVDKVDIDDGFVTIIETVREPKYRFWVDDDANGYDVYTAEELS